MQDNNLPTWGFTYRDIDGTISTKSFDTVSWTRALQEFVDFLKGTGFELDNDSIQINNRHDDSDNWFGGYCDDVDKGVEEWNHPDDTDLSMHFCPPFEGDPNDCAFKHEPTLKDLKDSVDALVLEISALNYYKEKELQKQVQYQGQDDFSPCSLEEFLRAITKVKGEQV
jgi:hypothetical protein